MNRLTANFTVPDTVIFKQQMLSWANQFNICSFLDSHQYMSSHQNVECLLAAGAAEQFSANDNILPQLSSFLQNRTDWLFGHMGYDIKKETARLPSTHSDRIGFPEIFFFRPETVLQLSTNTLTISTLKGDPAIIFEEILAFPIETWQHTPVITRPKIDKQSYLNIISKLQQHILKGDCYEINFCQEFFAEHAVISPLSVYQQLTAVSPNPFACFYKLEQRFLLCASPERYLQKKGDIIISQPIKGTTKRDPANVQSDEELMHQLQQSEKDKSENVMIVDLVRNDLSRICKEASVQVEELFGIYPFPQVYQMISTITGELKADITFPEIIEATFPMGSMTGAPKKRVMELIEQYEQTKRGIYSGAVGYIAPNGDFDFNVVIRSIMYNATEKYLNYLVGGGITFYSDPEKEYEECLVKAAAIREVLEGNIR